jgi:hypothetical protein
MKSYNKKLIMLVILLCSVFFPSVSFAHPGRTDSSGCHTCKTNCASWGLSTGEYHCHNSKGVSQPLEPIKSTHGDNGTGYTTPAPEYKTPKLNATINTNIQTSIKTTEKKSLFSKLFSWFK